MLVRSISLAVIVYIVVSYVLETLYLNLKLSKSRKFRKLEDLYNSSSGARKEESHIESILKPFIISYIYVIESNIPVNLRLLKDIRMKLGKAGIKTKAENFLAILIFRMIIVALIFLVIGFMLKLEAAAILYFAFFFSFGVYVLGMYNLARAGSLRDRNIHRQVPEIIDLIAVSVNAGLSFDHALEYIVRKSSGAFVEELAITKRDMNLGVSRKEALLSLAERCDDDEVRTFVTSIIQAEKMGTPVKKILNLQASAIREAHKMRAQEEAQKLSVKMLFPLAFFIFPLIFIVVLAPAILQFMQTF